jgi:hypothetical protein
MNQEYIIKKAWALSILGVLPFAWTTFENCFNVHLLQDIFTKPPNLIFFSYGAVILSFLGGIIWGFALQLKGNSNLSAWLLVLSIFPALIAWLAVLLFPQNISWLLLLGGFLSLLKLEHFLQQIAIIPHWFWLIRRNITLIVVSLILLNWFVALR